MLIIISTSFIIFLISQIANGLQISFQGQQAAPKEFSYAALLMRYNDLSSTCLDSEGRIKPAYECSGLIIRGITVNPEMKHAWSKKELNRRTNAFSVSFLRKDQLFWTFANYYDTGFIIYPHLQTPPNRKKNDLKVYCAFPLDGDTNKRKGRHLCEKLEHDESGISGSCNLQGINSLSKWIAHYENITSEDKQMDCLLIRQCAFDLTSETAAEDFKIVLDAHIYMRNQSEECSYRNNELRIEAWNDENCDEIPIEAFFYLIDVPGANETAVKHQDEFYECSGRKIPIVGIRLPSKDGRDLVIEKY